MKKITLVTLALCLCSATLPALADEPVAPTMVPPPPAAAVAPGVIPYYGYPPQGYGMYPPAGAPPMYGAPPQYAAPPQQPPQYAAQPQQAPQQMQQQAPPQDQQEQTRHSTHYQMSPYEQQEAAIQQSKLVNQMEEAKSRQMREEVAPPPGDTSVMNRTATNPGEMYAEVNNNGKMGKIKQMGGVAKNMAKATAGFVGPVAGAFFLNQALMKMTGAQMMPMGYGMPMGMGYGMPMGMPMGMGGMRYGF